MGEQNDLIVTELLRLVQDIDFKISCYKEEVEAQNERLEEIERKLESLRIITENRETSWLSKFFGV